MGHRNIAVLSSDPSRSLARSNRIRGVTDQMERSGLEDCLSVVVPNAREIETIPGNNANYRIGRANSASIYQNIGTDFENVLINPAIQECVKSVTAQFTAEELITERQKVGDLMREALAEKIGPYGFDIEVFNITSFEFSEEFNAAIEAKQTAQQNALKAEQDLARIKVEAQQQIEQARAEAESYRLKNQEITQETLAMEWINKWDGKLPSVASDGSMMFDISDIIAAAGSGKSASAPSTPVAPSAPSAASAAAGE